MENHKDPPWETVSFVKLGGMPLPPLIFSQSGWKETPHPFVSEVKEQIEVFNNPEEWELRKKITNPYEAIFSGHEHFPSVSDYEPLSRSYFKMIEMLSIVEKIQPFPLTFSSAHVCEGPGGFIQALTDYASKKGYTVQKIHAMTLKATRPNIPGWRRSAKYLREHPEISLEYGTSDTGDILLQQNQRDFARICKQTSQISPIHLFTADGGFDFSTDYTKQEQQVFPLLLASFLMGLQCLSSNGTMIIKCFDIYSDLMKDLLIGTGSLFSSMTLYKPATSRPCNAERYFIGVGYLGGQRAQRWILHLQEAQDRHSRSPLTRLMLSPLPRPLTQLFVEQIEEQENLQIQSIYDTLNLDKSEVGKLLERNIQVSLLWCKVFNVPIKTYFDQASA